MLSQWDLNQISINYASSGLHKTFQEAGEVRLCLGAKIIKAAVEIEDIIDAGDSLAIA